MDLSLWFTFATACFVLSAIPGPSVLVVTSQSIAHGWWAALLCIAGELLGGMCLMLASLLGVGAAVAASPAAFWVLKWFGVGYLFYLGLQALRSAIKGTTPLASPLRQGHFSAGFWTSVFNPKSLVFYLAFFTQFIDAARPLPLQYVLLVSTAVAMAGMVLGVYALIAVRLRPYISTPRAQSAVSGMSGSLYLAGGAWVAIAR